MVDPIPPSIRHLTKRLVAFEAARDAVPKDGCQASRVCDKLRLPLVKLAGVAGFRSLLSRALALAKMETSALDGVRVQPDGALSGFDGIPPDGVAEAGEAVVAQLINLLVTFIGEPLTLHIAGDAWSETNIGSLDAGSGEAS